MATNPGNASSPRWRARSSAARCAHRTVVAALCVAALACRDRGGAAGRRRLAPITNIRVPVSAPYPDTVRVAFDYLYYGCDTLQAIETRQTRGGVSFAVWLLPSDGPCTTSAHGGHVLHLVLPTSAEPYPVVFRQPTGPDSVRTIRFLFRPHAAAP